MPRRTPMVAIIASGLILAVGCDDAGTSRAAPEPSVDATSPIRSTGAFCAAWRDEVIPADDAWQQAYFDGPVGERAQRFDRYLDALEHADGLAPDEVRAAHEANLAFLVSISKPHYERYGWDLQPQTADPVESEEYNRALQSNLDDLSAIATFLQTSCGLTAEALGG